MESRRARVSYRQSYRKCGKVACATCRDGPGHGPYWYAFWREGARVRSRFIGRTLPEGAPEHEIEVRTLGDLQVRLAGGHQVGWTRRARELFTMLLSAPTGAVGREEVAESLWPDFDPVAAHQNVRVTVSALRRTLGRASWIRLEGPSVILAIPSESRDDLRFERRARNALVTSDLALMRVSIETYGGMYLPQDRYNDWTVYRRQVLADLRRELVLRAARLMAVERQLEIAVTWLRDVAAEDACDEQVARLLMSAYLMTGRRTEALRVFGRTRAALKTELEVEPEAETISLYRQLRAGASPDRAAMS